MRSRKDIHLLDANELKINLAKLHLLIDNYIFYLLRTNLFAKIQLTGIHRAESYHLYSRC
jgi:hypothetical protein